MILLIYVLMCLIASRKPGAKTVLAIFLLWLLSIVACVCVALRGHNEIGWWNRPSAVERIMKTDVVIDGDSTTVERLIRDDREIESVLEVEPKSIHIRVPEKHIDITVKRDSAALRIGAAGPGDKE